MGQIRKRGGVYWIRYYRDGRRFEESARTDKHETARVLPAWLIAELNVES